MHLVKGPSYAANQFWVATRFLESVTFVIGFKFIKSKTRLNAEIIFLTYFLISLAVFLCIMVWRIFPVCYIDGIGQTQFKIYAEYAIIAVLLLAGYLLIENRKHFSLAVYRLLFASLIFTIISEFCFTLYVSNYSTANELGHYAKLISFFLIYKANVETGFLKPTTAIFKNLKEDEVKYRTLAENMPGLIMRFDEQLNCLYTNSVSTKLMENSGVPLLISNREVPLMPTNLPQLISKVKQTQVPQETTLAFTDNGNQQIYAIQVIEEMAGTATDSTYLVIGQDVTKQKMAESQMLELNATKDRLFSIIAHDLKNPFTSLLSFSELIYKNAEKLSKEKVEQMGLRINESAKQAYALLENLLEWSRIQTGVLKASPKSLSIATLLTDVKRYASPLALPKDITVEIDTTTESTVYADPHMIATVLRNLVSNAIKFSYTKSTVIIKAEKQLHEVLFSVTDSGTGIEKENQEKLLRVDNTFTTPGTASEKGTGLGLVLCREFVEMNGGSIWLESEFGMGTTFSFTLPFH